jgi:TATA-box binding protein (TBP) (component of TFIID and TFIIIB)
VIKDKNGTLILFSSGRFRVMGCVDILDASFLAFKYLTAIDVDDYPEIYSQSYTSKAKLGYCVNLFKLSTCNDTLYMPELFAAVRMCKYNPISVNVFSTGSIVVCGLKEPEYMYIILKELNDVCKVINM